MLVANMKSILFLGSLLFVGALCQDEGPVAQNTTLTPKERMFSFLQVMKFPNDVCAGTNGRNGTCYSSDECSAKGGVNSGSCANGFGVCCTFALNCGQTSSENNTYLILGATTTPSPSVCTYTLCEANPNVCRIRLDFTTFVIAQPILGATRTAKAQNSDGGAIGDCAADTFVLSAPNNRASPIICGTNSGQHMYIDTSAGGCAKASFDFGASATSRQYEIKVTQYNCGDEMAGPSDCLQYFTDLTGTVKSYNFNLVAAAVPVTATHLSNQYYSMCFRRAQGKCALCFVASINNAAIDAFGLSLTKGGTTGAAKSQIDSNCITDYLSIPNAVIATDVLNTNAGAARNINGVQRICGRVFVNTHDTGIVATPVSVCTGQRPFKVVFRTDDTEVIGDNTLNADASEEQIAPGGIIGFSLDYRQLDC